MAGPYRGRQKYWRASVSILEIEPKRADVSIYNPIVIPTFAPVPFVPTQNITLTFATSEAGDAAAFNVDATHYEIAWMSHLTARGYRLWFWWPGFIQHEVVPPPVIIPDYFEKEFSRRMPPKAAYRPDLLGTVSEPPLVDITPPVPTFFEREFSRRLFLEAAYRPELQGTVSEPPLVDVVVVGSTSEFIVANTYYPSFINATSSGNVAAVFDGFVQGM